MRKTAFYTDKVLHSGIQINKNKIGQSITTCELRALDKAYKRK